MGENSRPPIGAAPAFYVLPKRMEELGGAITRYAGDSVMNRKRINSIRNWATESLGHCDTLDRMMSEEG